jgi:DNA-binding MarR family transcriptional regulator
MTQSSPKRPAKTASLSAPKSTATSTATGAPASTPVNNPPSTLAGTTAPRPAQEGCYDFSDQIGHLLRRAYQRHTAIFQAAIPDSDLTAAQFVTLCAVRDRQSCSLNEVVKATAIDQATIRGVVDRLKARSLLVVAPDPADGRKLVLKVTDEGLALVAATVPFAKEVTEQTFGALNPGERVAINYLLQAMIKSGEPEN